MSAGSEFFVGYLDGAPAGIRRQVRAATAVVALGGLVVGVVILLALRPLAQATFEFGTLRSVVGQVVEQPHPTLRVPRPGTGGGASRYLLVGQFKRGAQQLEGLDGQWVSITGSLVYRDDRTMIEVASVEPVEPPHGVELPAPAPVSLGEQTLVGEIVDSKCFLGVMNPGDSTVHRACATRCISGGIPPLLLVRDGAGRAAYLMLTDPAGRMVSARILTMIAEPLEITGTVERHDDLLVLRADPAGFRRLTDDR